MAFMTPHIEHMVMYHVETNHGTELVPEEVCGILADDEHPWPELKQYLEGSRTYSVTREEGWYGRLSANGYLDCTEWDGPHATAWDALQRVKEIYDVDDNGDAEEEES
jgi:hypothetical protein